MCGPLKPVDESIHCILYFSRCRMSSSSPSDYSPHLSTLALHADASHDLTQDVAPPIHLSSTFTYSSNSDSLVTAHEKASLQDVETHHASAHVYSRITSPNTSRLETILTSLLHAPSLTYSSGLAATHAIYTVLRPTRVFLTGGYHGVHGVLELLNRLTDGVRFIPHELDDADKLCGLSDVIHVETPLNPTGEVRSIKLYSEIARKRGAFVVVDATLAPPPIQDPFKHGADAVIHSGTKYFGGHSDMLLGVVATCKDEWMAQLVKDRVFLGSIPGSLEAWLGIRSLRTLSLRVERQARSAERIVSWLQEILEGRHPIGLSGKGGVFKDEDIESTSQVLHSIHHSTIQAKRQPSDQAFINSQMSNRLHSPVFAITCSTEAYARALPSRLRFWTHATSLGGVESLIEWRALSDANVNTKLLRLSVGVEDPGDLLRDLIAGCVSLLQPDKRGGAGANGHF